MLAALLAAAPGRFGIAPRPAQLPESTLAVRVDGGWRVWWRSDRAPAAWTRAHPLVSRAVRWSRASPGLDVGELELSGSGEAWRTRVAVARIDPKLHRLRLQVAIHDGGTRAAWTVDSAPPAASVAFNAGQFWGAAPWGWVVYAGKEGRRPRNRPLAVAVVVDTAGAVSWVASDSIEGVRGAPHIAWAFQSYPVLLGPGGAIPAPLLAPGRGVNLEHRDARLAFGTLPDGRVLVAITRFDALGGVLESAPFGLTNPELAALMGALGAARAVALDGGISAQLLVRDSTGAGRWWRGWRKVPMGMVGVPRSLIADR